MILIWIVSVLKIHAIGFHFLPCDITEINDRPDVLSFQSGIPNYLVKCHAGRHGIGDGQIEALMGKLFIVVQDN